MTLNYKEYDKIHAECKDISIRKNKNYGTSGLVKFGLKGMIIRMSDKMDRLIKLGYENEKDLNEESVRDTLKDLINYTTYCVMFVDKKLE